MKRIAALLTLSLALVVAVCLSGSAQEFAKMTLRVGHNNPTEHFIHLAAEAWGKKLADATGGAVTLEIYPAETLGPEREMIDAIGAGSGLDVYIGSTSPFTPHDTRFTFYEGPYLFDGRKHLFDFYNSDFVQTTLNAELAKSCNVQSIGQIYYGTRHVTSNKLAKTPADFKSLKIRAPKAPMFMDTVSAMGAAATPIEFSETYLALQQNVVDGQENPPASIRAMKFDEVQKYLILTGHMVQQNQIFLAEYSRAKMSPELLDIVLKTAKEVGEEYCQVSYDIEDRLLVDLGNNMEIVEVDQNLFREAMKPVYEKWIGIWGQDLMDAIAAAK